MRKVPITFVPVNMSKVIYIHRRETQEKNEKRVILDRWDTIKTSIFSALVYPLFSILLQPSTGDWISFAINQRKHRTVLIGFFLLSIRFSLMKVFCFSFFFFACRYKENKFGQRKWILWFLFFCAFFSSSFSLSLSLSLLTVARAYRRRRRYVRLEY